MTTFNPYEYPGKEIPLEEKMKRLYHYTSFESFVKIWLSQELLFSPAINMNDILEQNKIRRMVAFEQDTIFKKCLSEYKQISFTMDYDSYMRGCMSNMMWGHYAKSGNGVCIEFDPSKLNLNDCIAKSIEYTPYIPLPPIMQYLEEADINKFILDNLDTYFFKKSSDWQGENEFRVISNKQESLSIKDAITAIYVTSAFSKTCKFVEKLVGDIPVMYFHYSTNEEIRKPMLSVAKNWRRTSETIPETNKKIDFKGYDLILKL